ncbi:hypothetical protein HYR99_12780 [Candidatus Poribacteria bacterium]|nr:hypothetical protein [Candidatus Poribacteria bacterium]
MDDPCYPTSVFKDLYYFRWGVETFFDWVKNRLNLENFTGKSVEAVKPDFYATLFISRLESVLTEKAQVIWDQKTDPNRYRQPVNQAVSFNAIKNHVLGLFYTEPSLDRLCDRLTRLFLTTPVLIRPERKVERKKKKAAALLHDDKRLRKICF